MKENVTKNEYEYDTLEVTFYDDTQAFYNLEEVWKTSNPWRFRHE